MEKSINMSSIEAGIRNIRLPIGGQDAKVSRIVPCRGQHCPLKALAVIVPRNSSAPARLIALAQRREQPEFYALMDD